MAYDQDTLIVLHALTPAGQDSYFRLLEKKGDEIIFKHQHPIRWLLQTISELFA